MALVKFRRGWFAPATSRVVAKRRDGSPYMSVSGMRFKRGVQEVPDDLIPEMKKAMEPQFYEILEGPVEQEASYVDTGDLKDYDLERANSDQLVESHEKADQELAKQKKLDALAKARKAKQEKNRAAAAAAARR